MAKTKGEVVRAALAYLGLADYEFDITAEELATGVDFLNLMMANWSSKNLKVPFNFDGDSADDSGLPDNALEGVSTNLAIRLAPTYGKTPSMEVRSTAKQGLNALYADSARPRTQQLENVPKGAGFKTVKQSPFFETTERYPWLSQGYQDFSGGGSDFYVDDVGVLISIDFFGLVDLSTATALVIHYRKPSGEEGTWTATDNGDNAEYTTVAGDIDEAGVWYFQAFATFAGPTVVSSKIQSRWVGQVVEDNT